MADMNIYANTQSYINININSEVEPLVSIIIATYRREYSLKKALLSLTKQTYESIEIIVVDDNADVSWNNKVQLIIDYVKSQGNMRIVYIQNEENKGSAETRNIGIRTASGKYITFLDDDDIYLPDKINSQIKHMLGHNSDYCITDLDLFDENERLIEKRTRQYIKENSKENLLRYHLKHHMTGTDTIMFKKDYLMKIGGFPPINVGDEFYLMQRAIEAEGSFSYLSVCHVKAYVHTETNGLSSGESKINGENRLYEYKKRFFSRLRNSDIRYIKMRHYAVLAFAEMRRKKIFAFLKNSFCSFISSPIGCIRLLLEIL
jgi:glycosyltransferase involved in cell wall biosynthesis